MTTTVANLRRSPMFNMSLANTELFYSNFIAWMWEQPEYCHLLNRFFLGDDYHGYELYVRREFLSFDLVVLVQKDGESKTCNAQRVLVIENKVKSLPRSQQLFSYDDKIKSSFKGVEQHRIEKVLLTPGFDFEQPGWKHLHYSDLASLLKPFCDPAKPYVSGLVKDFITISQDFAKLLTEYSIDEKKPFYLSPTDNKHLKRARLHSLVDKWRFSQLFKMISDRLQLDLANDALVDAGTGYIRGALCEVKVFAGFNKNGNRAEIVIQLHRNKFCMGLVNFASTVPKSERIAKSVRYRKYWMNWEYLLSSGLDKKQTVRNRGAMNHYLPMFHYDYRLLASHVTTAEIVELFSCYWDELNNNFNSIESFVE